MILDSNNLGKLRFARKKFKDISTFMVCTISTIILLNEFYFISIRIKTQGIRSLLASNNWPRLWFISSSDKTLPFKLSNKAFVSITFTSVINGQFNLSPFDLRFFIWKLYLIIKQQAWEHLLSNTYTKLIRTKIQEMK